MQKNQVYFYHPDHLGSSSFIRDASGLATQHLEYLPFGEVFVEENIGAFNTMYKFNAKELDEESGLYYYGARYYDPGTSVFYGVDSMSDKYPFQSPFCYAANNPIRYQDINGEGPGDFLIPIIASNIGVKAVSFMQNQGMRNSEMKVASVNTLSTLKIYIMRNRGKAENLASGLPGQYNGAGDAVRHSLFSALNTKTAGSNVAKEIGDAHEMDRPEQPKNEREIDLFNNAVGREIAK